MSGTIALIVAGGTGDRMGGNLPKPYQPIGNESILRRVIKIFQAHPAIDGVRVVIRREHHALYKQAVDGLTLYPLVVGGETRQESVRRGLQSLRHVKPKRILVHDAARPLVSHALISRLIDTLGSHQAVIPTLPIADTVKQVASGKVTATLARESLVTVQTPQAFDYQTLLAAHEQLHDKNYTDDAALCEELHIPVATVLGEANNFKLTTQEDKERMETLLAFSHETRVGFGYDVHVLKPHEDNTPTSQSYIKLCGIRIPHTHYLEGHSDADVGLHAIVDAILGAIANGDIGVHFSPDDGRWKGADSQRFLMHAYELLRGRGGDIVHLDVTLVCEQPKVSPHREAMQKHVAEILKLSKDRVSIKATTTERLGFTGRSEGIAAHAVATIRVPRS